MTSQCPQIRERLTAYLDGDLEGDRATVVRGHLRECAACRQVSEDEAVLRDGLRALPTIDPPTAMWAGIQAQLAAAEVASAKQPAWRRALARLGQGWTRHHTRNAIAGGLLVAAATTILVVRATRDAAAPAHHELATGSAAPTTSLDVPKPAPPAPAPADVTADIAEEPHRIATQYEAAAAEVLALVEAEKAAWPEDKRVAYDDRLAGLRADIAAAEDTRGVQRGWRALIRFAQQALTRDTIAMVGNP